MMSDLCCTRRSTFTVFDVLPVLYCIIVDVLPWLSWLPTCAVLDVHSGLLALRLPDAGISVSLSNWGNYFLQFLSFFQLASVYFPADLFIAFSFFSSFLRLIFICSLHHLSLFLSLSSSFFFLSGVFSNLRLLMLNRYFLPSTVS
jgi:hypothetical protein